MSKSSKEVNLDKAVLGETGGDARANVSNIKTMGVLTSGGDCPGMNAAVRSVVRFAVHHDIKVYGVSQGYKGLIEDDISELTSKSVANTIHVGGTYLRSARSEEFRTMDGVRIGLKNLQKKGIEGLIVIGGDGSMRGAYDLYKEGGVRVVGIPGTIDNDIYGTDISLGVDTALNNIVRNIDMINNTASSHDRTFLIEVMGRDSGYLAVMSAIASGAEAVIIPEHPCNLESIIELIRDRYENGKSRSIIIVAEGAGSAIDFGKAIELMGGFDTRIIVLGHLQRGGSPTYFDRILASKMGVGAVQALLDGKSAVMTGLKRNQVELVPFDEVHKNKKKLDANLLEMAHLLG